MPNDLLLLVGFKEKAIKAPRNIYLYCVRKNKKVTAKVDLRLHVPSKFMNLFRQRVCGLF